MGPLILGQGIESSGQAGRKTRVEVVFEHREGGPAKWGGAGLSCPSPDWPELLLIAGVGVADAIKPAESPVHGFFNPEILKSLAP